MTVENIMTGSLEAVPQTDMDISGLRCGSGSTMCVNRANNNASNLESHTTGKDIISYTGLLDGPVPHKLGFIENTLGSFDKVKDDNESDAESLEEGSVLTTGEEWRSQLSYRGFSHVNATQSATDNGGPESRDRFYEANLHNSVLDGTRSSNKLA